MEPWLAELHRSEDRLRAVFESSPLAILEVDLETRVIRWNRAAERIFGWTREEMLGRAALPAGGSGLRGLADRVEALGGTLEIVSPEGGGTTLRAAIPLETECR